MKVENREEQYQGFFWAAVFLFVMGLTSFFIINMGMLNFILQQDSRPENMMMWAAMLIVIGAMAAALNAFFKLSKLIWIALIVGTLLSSGVFIYAGESITSVLVVGSVVFFIMCVYGYVTKLDLYRPGPLLLLWSLGTLISVIAGSMFGYSDDLASTLKTLWIVIPVSMAIDKSNS